MNHVSFEGSSVWYRGPAPVIVRTRSINEDITLFNERLVQLTVIGLGRRSNEFSPICLGDGYLPLLFVFNPLRFRDLVGGPYILT